MKKRKPTNKHVRATEMTFAGDLKEWINNIIKEEQLSFGNAKIEIGSNESLGRADIIILHSPRSTQKVVTVIEVKQPYEDVKSISHIDQAYGYARQLNTPSFCVCNGKELAWFDISNILETGGLDTTRGFVDAFELSKITTFNNIEPRSELTIKQGIKTFLRLLHERYKEEKPVPLRGLNEFLIIRLQRDIESLFQHYLYLVEEKARAQNFRQRLQDWFETQGWSFTFSYQDYERVARQAAYLLINKILIYTALQQRLQLSPLEIPDSLRQGALLMNILISYFQEVLKIDYSTIFSTDTIDIGFPDNEEAIAIVRGLVNDLNTYDFSRIGYDIIGYIFERLIPQDERHKLGQYFTRAEVVDLILAFCVKQATDKILDPSVGAGTFLVRAYQYKKSMKWKILHDEIIQYLWGCDIVQFPAHLTSINIAVRGLDSIKNFPRILCRDFFCLSPETMSFSIPIQQDNSENPLFNVVEYQEEHPGLFDAVVGNPPYTRQEYLGDLMRTETYKENLIQRALFQSDGQKLATFSKRAGLYAYFLVHSYKFLREGGRIGFVTSNPWLNAAYGSGLQEFILNHFKIIAILESDVERWFPGVAVDNCVIVLEKCSGVDCTAERGDHIVRFVRFTDTLVPNFAIPTHDDEASHRERFDKLKKLVAFIENTTQFYEGDGLYVYPKRQSELLDEGIDVKKGTYIGSRWGRFISAPPAFYRVVEELRDHLVPLTELAQVTYGLKTGANSFFYLTEEEIQRYGIEECYWGTYEDEDFIPNIVMKSPTQSESIRVDIDHLQHRALIFHASKDNLQKTKAWNYIQMGEKQALNDKPTCHSREPEEKHKEELETNDVTGQSVSTNIGTYGWYDLGIPARSCILWPELSSSSRKRRVFLTEQPIIANSKLYNIYVQDDDMVIPFVATVNSTIVDLVVEFSSQSYGGFRAPSNLSIEAVRNLLIPDIRLLSKKQKQALQKAFHSYSNRKLGSLREEYQVGEDNVIHLDNIQPDLRVIDHIIMGELLGLTEAEQKEVYQTVLRLAEGRFQKAKSGETQTRGMVKGGIDEPSFIEAVLSHADADIIRVNVAYRAIVTNKRTVTVTILPSNIKDFRGEPVLEKELWGYVLKLGGTRNHPIEFRPEEEVTPFYYRAWALLRVDTVKMPVDIEDLASEVDELNNAIEDLRDTIHSFTSKIMDRKQRKRLESLIWNTVKPQLIDTTLAEE